jgi:hypothetical protein
MINKLNQRDVRALKMGAVGIVAIVVLLFALEGYDRWNTARQKSQELETKLDHIDLDKAKRSGLTALVPVFQMPVEKESQRFLFRDKLNEQLRNAGINSLPLQEVPGGKSPIIPEKYELLRLKCSAKCSIEQIFNLLADLKNNPYIVGVEEMRIKKDARNQRQFDFDLTVSTLATLTK